ncbi:MAG TPA: dodecin [Acidobacteriota bacterium]|nr:dodecin [Acidobacteriota bacterium]
MAKNKKNGSRVYKRIDLVGLSSKGFEDAIQNAVSKANETLQGLSWFEVKELRGAISNGIVREYQAIVTVSFEVL